MTIRCRHGKFVDPVRFDSTAGHCWPCYQALEAAKSRPPEPKVEDGKIALDCIHVGPNRPAPPGQPPHKAYRWCEVKHETVCKCGCNPSGCDLYEGDNPAAEDLADELVSKPPFDLRQYPDILVTDAHRVLLRRVVARPPSVTPGDGRGIVQAVGGTLFFACAYAAVSRLRHLGCSLPIEWWYLGPAEFDPKMIAVAETLGVRCVDALAVADRVGRPRRIGGWELKSFAVAHSAFREVLFLDADNLAVRNPDTLFDDPGYLAKGAMFWPDLPQAKGKKGLASKVWTTCGLRYVDTPALESGQFLIDKHKCARELGVCRHLNDYSDYYYQRWYGDKDSLLIAWHACAQHVDNVVTDTYARPARGAEWVWPAIQQYGPDGTLMFQHVCQAKTDMGKGRALPVLDKEQVVAAGAALRGLWSGKIWTFDDQTEEEKKYAAGMTGKWLYRRHDTVEVVELRSRGKIGVGASVARRTWSVRNFAGKWTLILVGAGHKGTRIATAFLEPGEDGVWRGRMSTDSSGIEMMPAAGAAGWVQPPLATPSTTSALVYSDEVDLLVDLAAKVPDGGLVIELGSGDGRTTAMLADAVGGRDVRITACDLWDDTGYTAFQARLEADQVAARVTARRGTARDVIDSVGKASVDLLYARALPTSDEVRALLSRVKNGGVIAGYGADDARVRENLRAALGCRYRVTGQSWHYTVRR